MKHFVVGLLAVLPLCALADIVSTKKDGNIENVKVISVAVDSVVYKRGDTRKAIASAEVEGVLYDNGKFVTPPLPVVVNSETTETADGSRVVDTSSTSFRNVQSTKDYSGAWYPGKKMVGRWTKRINNWKGAIVKESEERKEQRWNQRKEELRTQKSIQDSHEATNTASDTTSSTSTEGGNW